MRSNQTSIVLAFAVSLAAAAAGLAASAILAIDSVRTAAVFCLEGSACDAVRHSAYANPLGVPLPFAGLAGFAALGIAVVLEGRRARLVGFALSVGGALVGALLLAVQAHLGHFCPYCCVADASALASVLPAAWRLRKGAAPPSRRARYAGAAVLGLAAAVPLGLGLWIPPAPPSVPPVIASEIARSPRGDVTIVDFVDFECPFCRTMNAELEPLLASHKDRVRLVRRQVPLRSHPHALDAARAACCGERLGEADAMAEALFHAPVDELTPEGCENIAQRLRLPVVAFRACVSDPSTDARIEADRAEFKAAGGFALPTLWIGNQPLVGAQPVETLTQALSQAIARVGG